MKAIRVLPNQIPMLWPSIKYAVANVNSMDKVDLNTYLNKLLAQLLNDKAQCFIRMDDNRCLIALAITSFKVDEVTGERSLFLSCLYSFEAVVDSRWNKDMELLVDFARSNGCKSIDTYSSNGRVFEIVKLAGFSELYRCFSMEI